MSGRFSLLAAAFLVLPLSLALAQDLSRFDGHYVGELTLKDVIGSGDCTTPPLGSLYPLSVSHGEVRFAYVPRFATTLVGRVAPDGSFAAIALVKKGRVEMAGRIQGIRVTATIASPSCNYTYQTP
jgi:hypothetical protein